MTITPVAPNPIDRYQTMQAAVLIPAAQSITTAVFAGMSAAAVAWAAHMESPWAAGLVTATVTNTGTWLVLLRRWGRAVEWLEDILQQDINGDGKIGSGNHAPPTPRTVRVVMREAGRLTMDTAPVDESRLAQWVSGLMGGLALTESTWVGRGKLFSQNEYRALRDWLIERGLAYWKNPRNTKMGWDLTAAGRNFARQVVTQALPHPEGASQNRP